MKADKTIDYSYAYMQAKKALDDAYKAMLKKDFGKAAEAGMHAIAETRLMVTALKEHKHALRK